VSTDSAPITVRVSSSLELTRAVATTITAPIYRDGALVAATSVAATLYDSAGAVVATGGALAGTLASWTITPAATVTLGTGYRIEWTIGHAGGTVYSQTSAAIVRRALYPVISDVDLFRRDRLLDPSESGYRGAESDTDWQDYLDEAWTEILGRLYGQGHRPALIMSPEALRNPHLFLTLALIYRMQGNTEMATEYDGKYEASWASLRLVYDSDDNGAPDDSGARQTGSPVLWTC
jgi:hypothetical protein